MTPIIIGVIPSALLTLSKNIKKMPTIFLDIGSLAGPGCSKVG